MSFFTSLVSLDDAGKQTGSSRNGLFKGSAFDFSWFETWIHPKPWFAHGQRIEPTEPKTTDSKNLSQEFGARLVIKKVNSDTHTSFEKMGLAGMSGQSSFWNSHGGCHVNLRMGITNVLFEQISIRIILAFFSNAPVKMTITTQFSERYDIIHSMMANLLLMVQKSQTTTWDV